MLRPPEWTVNSAADAALSYLAPEQHIRSISMSQQPRSISRMPARLRIILG